MMMTMVPAQLSLWFIFPAVPLLTLYLSGDVYAFLHLSRYCEFCSQNSSSIFTCVSVCLSVPKRDILHSFPYSYSKLTQPLPQYTVHRTLNLVYFFLLKFSTSTFPPWSSWSPWFINGSIVSFRIRTDYFGLVLLLFSRISFAKEWSWQNITMVNDSEMLKKRPKTQNLYFI